MSERAVVRLTVTAVHWYGNMYGAPRRWSSGTGCCGDRLYDRHAGGAIHLVT